MAVKFAGFHVLRFQKSLVALTVFMFDNVDVFDLMNLNCRLTKKQYHWSRDSPQSTFCDLIDIQLSDFEVVRCVFRNQFFFVFLL
jgi:hypothetical protein